MLGKYEGGNERYIKNLSLNLIEQIQEKNLVKIAVQNDYFLKQNDFPKNNLIKIDYDNNFFRIFYFLAKIADIKKFDIVHSTYIAPYLYRAKSVITVHDLSFKKYPQFYTLKEKAIFDYLLPISISRASAIIVPSRFTRDEFIRFFPKYKNKVFVVYEGADRCFSNIDKDVAKKEVGKKYGVTDHFLLVLNSRNPKKNVDVVIEAFKRIQTRYPKLKLVVIGKKDNIGIKNMENVHFFNNISDYDLNLFYNCCQIFLNPSVYEGFNLSIIEALKTGAIVMAADIKVNRELYEDAPVYFDPKNVSKIEKEALKILKNPKIINRYRKIAFKFDWKKNTAKMLEIYKKVDKK
jgi:glycosyltransferase involved in cell wall biosynthesis